MFMVCVKLNDRDLQSI
ncbi:BnaUnng05050D [Brassica napus]|uniref:BnaUnng05050D protein n=1 Tax=Brassica napus TaxID=3708 RepID=A0A078JXK7_BRANA|nr:BnaUnng05050D [Brassica napus]